MISSGKVYKVKQGDLFAIPLGDGSAYVGQVISEYKSAWYVVIYDYVISAGKEVSAFADILASPPLFGSIVFDARLRPGMWEIIGNVEPDSVKHLPAFTYGSSDTNGVYVTDFHSTRSRPASGFEAQNIATMKIRSPLILEKAVRAHAGREPWLAPFDELRVGIGPSSAELFGSD